MQSGSVVRVRVYGDEVVRRRVVAVNGERASICLEEEYLAAQHEARA